MIGDVALDPQGPIVAVHRTDLVDDGGHTVGAEVGDHHTRPLVGEEVCGGAAHPARGSGDDRDLALDRA